MKDQNKPIQSNKTYEKPHKEINQTPKENHSDKNPDNK